MKIYSKILIWENIRRLEKLHEFRALVLEYFNNSRVEWMADGRIEEEKAISSRVMINRGIDEIHDIILCSGINPSITWSPPPAVGGYRQQIDLIQNIFNLHAFRIEPNTALDFLDRAIGIYESNQRSAQLRTFNPIFYVGLIFDHLVEIPFALIGKIGLDRQKVESSLIGKLVKGSLYLVTVLAAFLTILQILDIHEPVKNYLNGLIGWQ